MSRLAISQYYRDLDRAIQYGGKRNEASIRYAFHKLLNEYCQPKHFELVAELQQTTKKGNVIRFDGVVRDALQSDLGYWEAKDEYDNLDEEIEKKLAKGYPDDNILFEDSQTAILLRKGEICRRISMRDDQSLDQLLTDFINYERPEVKDFREAIECFKQNLPTILVYLRNLMAEQEKNNPAFLKARDKFLKICQQSINPEVNAEDIREMIIQHILTEDIFTNIFNESQFHRENNIARELVNVIETFFIGSLRRNTLGSIEHYYVVIRRKASSIYDHHEKQKFLKVIYENFYKIYNPHAADRLGIVYTPNEIVKFMIESVDFLLDKHFKQLLADPNVEILDPATGTGTFITELIDYLPKDKLKHKYKNDIYCNEVSILPYYIANLNIEFTYKQKMGEYEEFNNICFMDTLDHTTFQGKQWGLFPLSVENTERIKRQNEQKISVIIGNPPYNANQQNENDNNKNRSYKFIDNFIKASYVKASKAQKTKVYDMYSRFFCWGTDRLGKDGILAFITNSSFIDAKGFDGFRKTVADEFSHIYIIDLGGNIRTDKTGNVFGIKLGVAITFMIKSSKIINKPCKIQYYKIDNLKGVDDKLKFLNECKLSQISFENIKPDKDYNWIDITDNDFDNLIPIVNKLKSNKESIFDIYSNGVSTNRDEWVYDFSLKILEKKCKFFIDGYNLEVKRWSDYKKSNNYQDIKEESNPILDDFLSERSLIKWSQRIKRDKLRKGKSGKFNKEKIIPVLYRPFVSQYLYFEYIVIDLMGQWQEIFFNNHFEDNIIINICTKSLSQDLHLLASKKVVDLHFTGDTQCLPFYRYNEEGTRIDNITYWGLNQFRKNYKDQTITKENIFHYVYAVLHNPAYRQKYEPNLKREFPRIPFYENFFQWTEWGQKLMELHINYETIEPYPLKRLDIPSDNTPKPKLKADKIANKIILDDITTLENIPKIAWDYKLGNRCAFEWILDQYKEKKPKDPTIAEKFNTYKFADYKEQVIELLQRVCTVSIETMQIIQLMEKIDPP